jgi:hypothetical protein
MVASLKAVGSDDIFDDASKRRVCVLGNPTQTDAREVGAGFMEVFQQKRCRPLCQDCDVPCGSRRLDRPLRARVGKAFCCNTSPGRQERGNSCVRDKMTSPLAS